MNYAIRSVIEAIQVLGHDEDFSPTATEYWIPTDAIAGTVEKIEVLRSRIEQGLPLFHPLDNPMCHCSQGKFDSGPAIRTFKIHSRRPVSLCD